MIANNNGDDKSRVKQQDELFCVCPFSLLDGLNFVSTYYYKSISIYVNNREHGVFIGSNFNWVKN